MFISLIKIWGGLIPLTINPCEGCFTVNTAFLQGLQTGLWGLICNVRIYVLLRRRPCHYHFLRLVYRKKMTCHESLTYYPSLLSVRSDTYITFLRINFSYSPLDFVCTHRVLLLPYFICMYYIYGIEENNVSRLYIYSVIWYLMKNNIFVKTLHIVY